jgi:DNA-directed RNA polymerase subunit RPC12/RpoP
MTVSPLTLSTVQCPKCGSHSIVEYKPTVYRCLKCDFEKDLSRDPESEKTSNGSALLSLLAGFGLVLVALL